MTNFNTNNTPKLSIVFLNFNRLLDTRKTSNHLKTLCHCRKDIEIIAVDNGSKDGTSQFLESQSDWLTCLLLKKNIGIEGLNLGFEIANGEYILVLDDDSHPLNIDTIERLIELLDRFEDIGAVACKIVSEDFTQFKTWHIPDVNISEPCQSIAFVGCGFAIRRELFRKMGWFPAKYFLYQNEIDVAIKIRQLGYKIYYEPKCTIIHRNSPTGRAGWRQVFYPTRNTIWLLREYAPFPSSIYYIFSRLCFGFIRAVESKEYRWYFKAVKEGFNCKVKKSYLSRTLKQELLVLWNQNSIFHQIIWALRRSAD
ncbi:MAG: glycosyltransferase family 2 protein [Desulfamplus sp.]|nr:glycosyltransferase family 2 protein [Desulfamplus sp.]